MPVVKVMATRNRRTGEPTRVTLQWEELPVVCPECRTKGWWIGSIPTFDEETGRYQGGYVPYGGDDEDTPPQPFVLEPRTEAFFIDLPNRGCNNCDWTPTLTWGRGPIERRPGRIHKPRDWPGRGSQVQVGVFIHPVRATARRGRGRRRA